MRKLRVSVKNNNRIMINLKNNNNVIEYKLVDVRTGREISLGEIDFSLSVKKYFGVKGRTIGELYAFDDWHNKKLAKEMNRLWRAMEQLALTKKREPKVPVYVPMASEKVYDEERCA